MNPSIDVQAVAADVLLRLLFYDVVRGVVLGVIFGTIYILCEKLLGRER